jgi:predicted Rossmann-fold nucleotide-binding protein
VGSMHERKRQMAELSDAFIALPGGIGTLEEFAEILTWGQHGLHRKPCGIPNVAGYFGHLLRFLDQAVSERFLTDAHRNMVLVADSPDELLDRFAEYDAPRVDKNGLIVRRHRSCVLGASQVTFGAPNSAQARTGARSARWPAAQRLVRYAA